MDGVIIIKKWNQPQSCESDAGQRLIRTFYFIEQRRVKSAQGFKSKPQNRNLFVQGDLLSLIELMDADIVLRPFQIEDSVQLHQAVRESLQDLKPWMSWATENYTELTARGYIAIT